MLLIILVIKKCNIFIKLLTLSTFIYSKKLFRAGKFCIYIKENKFVYVYIHVNIHTQLFVYSNTYNHDTYIFGRVEKTLVESP